MVWWCDWMGFYRLWDKLKQPLLEYLMYSFLESNIYHLNFCANICVCLWLNREDEEAGRWRLVFWKSFHISWLSLVTLRSFGGCNFSSQHHAGSGSFLIQSHAGIKRPSSSQPFFYWSVYLGWFASVMSLCLCCVGFYPMLNK